MVLPQYPRMFQCSAMDVEASGLHSPTIHLFSHTQLLRSLSVLVQTLTCPDLQG